jgi:hypothetical protein
MCPNHIAGDELRRRGPDPSAVAESQGGRRESVLEGRQRSCGPTFLDKAKGPLIALISIKDSLTAEAVEEVLREQLF